MVPLDPKVNSQADDNEGIANTWSKYNIDDLVNEGEQDNGDLNLEEETDADIVKEKTFLNHIDVGPGNAIDEENERDTQHPPTFYKKSIRKNKMHEGHAAGLLNVPYVDAGTDRVVNEHMFAFFKKHPQYHTTKAHWITAERWKKWMLMSGDEADSRGLNGKESEARAPGDGDSATPWKKCPENISKEWPEAPQIQCNHFAVSPVGFWGCKTLFEDGTCQKTEFYNNIRWDGLDAYPIPKGNPDAAPGQQYHNPNAYQDEHLPGGER